MKRKLRKALALSLLGLLLLFAVSGRHSRRWFRPFSGSLASRLPRERAPVVYGEPGALQSRDHGVRVAVSLRSIYFDDGDTVKITWSGGTAEEVRILGIDAPEIAHKNRGRPLGQQEGPDAVAFARKAFGQAKTIELLRADRLDKYGRTLGYFFLDGRNFSELIIEARLAYETVSAYGSNGLRSEAAGVLSAARKVGTPSFEDPSAFRKRLKETSGAK